VVAASSVSIVAALRHFCWRIERSFRYAEQSGVLPPQKRRRLRKPEVDDNVNVDPNDSHAARPDAA
jgi:hypothetical protein